MQKRKVSRYDSKAVIYFCRIGVEIAPFPPLPSIPDHDKGGSVKLTFDLLILTGFLRTSFPSIPTLPCNICPYLTVVQVNNETELSAIVSMAVPDMRNPPSSHFAHTQEDHAKLKCNS